MNRVVKRGRHSTQTRSEGRPTPNEYNLCFESQHSILKSELIRSSPSTSVHENTENIVFVTWGSTRKITTVTLPINFSLKFSIRFTSLNVPHTTPDTPINTNGRAEITTMFK
mmetsp:Transcript_20726/g.38578  ORF Transcript_20726/g.38578 Transcript_20726/m.38578 type:complete len:112 (-) Transcript_20726:77-412(-)